MLAQLLEKHGVGTQVMASEAVSAANLFALDATRVQLACLSYVEPGGFTNARYLAQRLRRKLPGAKIFVGFWTSTEAGAELRQALTATGADLVVTSLRKAVEQIVGAARVCAPPPCNRRSLARRWHFLGNGVLPVWAIVVDVACTKRRSVSCWPTGVGESTGPRRSRARSRPEQRSTGSRRSAAKRIWSQDDPLGRRPPPLRPLATKLAVRLRPHRPALFARDRPLRQWQPWRSVCARRLPLGPLLRAPPCLLHRPKRHRSLSASVQHLYPQLSRVG
jgi:hypothetical protein